MYALILLEALFLNLPADFSPDVSQKLGSNRYAVRQAEAKKLEKNWPYSSPALRRASRNSDQEVAEKARSIIANCRSKDLSDAGLPPWADWPLWNGTTWDHSKIPWYSRLLKQDLQYDFGEQRELWANYHDVSTLWASRLIDHNCPPTLIKIWFAVGRNVDAKWYELQNKKTPDYEWNRP